MGQCSGGQPYKSTAEQPIKSLLVIPHEFLPFLKSVEAVFGIWTGLPLVAAHPSLLNPLLRTAIITQNNQL
jgi:hypothetical protein